MTDALKHHWPEYLIEGTCLGLFMISAFTFGTILEHPASPGSPGHSKPDPTSPAHGDRNGVDCHQHHLFALGQTVRRPYQPVNNVHILQTRQDRQVGCRFLHRFSVHWRRRRRDFGCHTTFKVGVASVSQLRNHTPRDGRHQRSFFRRGCNCLYSYVGDLESLEPHKLAQIDRLVRRRAGRHLYNHRSANFRDEHESRAEFCICGSSPSLARPVALFHCSARRHVVCRGSPCADPRRPERRLRQTPSRK